MKSAPIKFGVCVIVSSLAIMLTPKGILSLLFLILDIKLAFILRTPEFVVSYKYVCSSFYLGAYHNGVTDPSSKNPKPKD